MKQLVVLFLVLTFIGAVAIAEIDVRSMTDEELLSNLRAIQNEITHRTMTVHGGDTIVDQDGIQVILTGNILEGWMGPEIEAILFNNSESSVAISLSDVYVNGWAAEGLSGMISAIAGKKAKGGLMFTLDNTDAKAINEIQTVEFKIHVYNPDNYRTLFDTEEKIITLKLPE